MEPDGLQGPVFPAADQRVWAVLRRIGETVELFGGHVGRIEVGAGRSVAVAVHERFAADAVPGTVVDQGKFPGGRVGERLHRGLVAEDLVPIDGVGLVGGETVEVQHLLAVVGNAFQARGLDLDGCIFIHPFLERGTLLFFAGNRQDGDEYCGE